jgi:hypothetical protein
MRNAYKMLVGRLEGKRPLEKPRCEWKNNIKMDVKERDVSVGTERNWLRTGQSCGNVVMKILVP